MARLAEAKGAAEQLLSQAYANRDHVALIAFRNSDADLLLPPTRSLARTKRVLGSLAGGGRTPLAAGLRHALLLASTESKRGRTSQLVLMTDGRANIDLSGEPGRIEAQKDATSMARAIRAAGMPCLVVDSGLRTSAELKDLTGTLAADFIRLPRGTSGAGASTLLDTLV